MPSHHPGPDASKMALKNEAEPKKRSCCFEERKRHLKLPLVRLSVFVRARDCVRVCERNLKNKRQRQYRCISLSEPNMKQRKQPLWSLPTCQSALHRDCMLRLLMCCTVRSETRMQTQTHFGEGIKKKRKREHRAKSDWCRHSNPSPRRYNHDDQCSVGKVLVYYSILGFQLASETVRLAHLHFH